MAILNNSNAISAGGYDVNNSVRLRSSASAYFSRTPASTTNQTTFTFSFWLKRGSLGVEQFLYVGRTSSNFPSFAIRFNSNDTLQVDQYTTGGSLQFQVTTTQVFRDPSAWYHIVIAFDTTQGTSSNRVKFYSNGSQITAFGTATYPSSSLAVNVNTTNVQYINSSPTNGSYSDCYMAEYNFIDGSAKTPSDFGETDATTGVWKPKAYSGTYGTNGFYLKFSDIATTSGSNAGLGKDFSGNTNYWTTNNISVTSGTTYDAMKDSPTNTSSTVANFPVYDQLTPSSVSGSAVRSISAGNLYVTNSGPNGWSAIGTTMVMTSGSGKWYWEVTCSGTTSNGTMIGIHRPFTSTSTFPSAILGYDTPPDPDGYGYYMGGNKYNNSGAGVAYGASYTAGDVIGVALDMSTAGSASITFYKNNTSQGVAFSSLTGDFFAAVSQAQANGLDINFGQRPFTYTPPTGFVALNTYNLPTPTILQGNKYMDANLYSGNNSTQSIVNAGQFKPDLVWIKSRNTSGANHTLTDSVRGVNKFLIPNLTDTEYNIANTLTSFNSNGFSLGNTAYDFNISGNNYVGWQWQAGQGSTSSNTSGSITSTVSVNTTAGFSVVTYTGTGANATVGHGLGVAPSFTAVKCRNDGTIGWVNYHASLGNTQFLNLNSTNAAGTGSTVWNNTSPTSTTIALGTDSAVNGSTKTYVIYAWAEIAGFSKFTSYTGNGSADGPFIFLGFRPKFIMIKGSSASGNPWYIVDSSRNTYNIAGQLLEANSSAAESTYDFIDFLSNGFKIRNTGSGINGSGATFIVAAWAENPFKNSNAR